MYGIVSVVVVILLIVGVMYNRLVRQRNLLDEAWSGIDVQLKRRHNLIPNIVETVQGYMKYERKVFEEVTRLRSQLSEGNTTVQEKGKLENSITRTLKSIFALAEAYPDLKANQNFMELQNTLKETEEQIQLSRRYYNGAARNYNIMVQSFPNNIVASLFRFTKAEFFEIEEETDRETPAVTFN
jgi:LemA protein